MTREEQLKRIEYLTKEIEMYRKKANISYKTAKIAVKACSKLSSDEKKKISSILYKFPKSKPKMQSLQKKQIEKKLEEQYKNYSHLDYMDLEPLVREEFHDTISTTEKDNIIRNIHMEPAETIRSELQEYLTYKNMIKKLSQEIEKVKKIKTVEKKESKVTEEITYTTEFPSKYYEPQVEAIIEQSAAKIESPRQTEPKKVKTTQKSTTINKNMLPSEIINYIANKHQNKTTLNSTEHNYLDQEDEELIANYIGVEAYNQSQLFTDISEKLLDQNTISVVLTKFTNYDKTLIKTKKVAKPTLIELLEMAKITHNSTVNHLLKENIVPTSKHMIIKNAAETRKNPLTYLQKYEEAYNIYMKYYNSLSKEEKEQEELKAEKNKYKYADIDITNFFLISPKMLKNKINETIKETMLNDHPIYGNQRDFITTAKIEKATTLMEYNDIRNLYNSMKNRRENAVAYYAKINHPLPEKPYWFVDLQYNFCNAIYYRQTKNLSEEELKKINKDKELYKICTEILGEEPLFMTQKYTKEKAKPKTVMEEAALANERFFNMNKIEQTFNRINGNWRKFEEKLEEMVKSESKFTDKEIAEELKGMFR